MRCSTLLQKELQWCDAATLRPQFKIIPAQPFKHRSSVTEDLSSITHLHSFNKTDIRLFPFRHIWTLVSLLILASRKLKNVHIVKRKIIQGDEMKEDEMQVAESSSW